MSADSTMAANIEIAQMWTLNDDRQSVKLRPAAALWRVHDAANKLRACLRATL